MKESSRISLILGSHAHVPSGASESESESVYENIMLPFVSNLYRYSNIQAVLHYSGVLLNWVERTHPGFFMLIEDMATRKQVEILGGGFYEPVMPLIPLHDRIGQIEFLTTYLRRNFGKRPVGCWIPGMAWEQNMVSSLAASDMSYTFLSQEQFIKAGFTGEDIYYPCISEDQGKIIIVFPVSLQIENLLAQKSSSQVFLELVQNLENENINTSGRIISVFPKKVNSNVNEANDIAWNSFFEELTLSKNIVETVLPAKIYKNFCNLKKASFPNSSSIDSLSFDSQSVNSQSINSQSINSQSINSQSTNNDYSPRHFLIDHNEINGVYSKMIFTNVLINQLKGDKYRKQNAREELWKAQDFCLFIPSGFNNRHELRKAAYKSLIHAEYLTREKGKFTPLLIHHDFNLDGENELLFQDADINCYIQMKGASVFELDYFPKEWNYLDCGCALKGNGTDSRAAFADSIIPYDTKPEELLNEIPEKSRLCFNEKYDALSQERKGKSCFKLHPTPALEKCGNNFGYMEIVKCYSLKKDMLSVSYSLKNTAEETAKFNFVCEIIFSFSGDGDDFARLYSIDNSGKEVPLGKTMKKIDTLKILDVKNEVQLLLSSSKTYSLLSIPVYDGGLYQANKFITLFSVSLGSGESWTNDFSLKFSH